MPRASRQKSGSGIYHVILRGINRQQVFHDEEDYRRFISLLMRYRDVSGYELYAYCLMGNHIHLLLREGAEPLAIVFRRIGASFVYWYNLKYRRTGHLFQDRFKSEAVEDDRYFLTVLRYILRNPVKAGICTTPGAYAYSNYQALVEGKGASLPCEYSGEQLAQYIAEDSDDRCMDIPEEQRRGVTDADAEKWIRGEFKAVGDGIGQGDRKELERSVRRLCEKGVSIRQLSRLTGISKSLIERALR